MPSGLCTPLVESETAITFTPSAARNFARKLPTLPKPWTAARSRLEPAERSAHVERLARDDAEHRVPLVHRVRVEDPGHDRPVGADVGSRYVLLGPDLVDDLRRVAARHLLELAAGELLRVAGDAPLRAAERDVHERALPRHPHRQRLHLVERDV